MGSGVVRAGRAALGSGSPYVDDDIYSWRVLMSIFSALHADVKLRLGLVRLKSWIRHSRLPTVEP